METGKLPTSNKRKIFNDPVYGFITIPDETIFDIIEHPYFQRLRRIMQLGLTHLVYPGALHTRFHHSLGAMFLMNKAISTLRLKGIRISKAEEQGALMAILLHDIGHSPFSHTLEGRIVHDLSHEKLSLLFMQELHRQKTADFSEAMEIFSGSHPNKFLHQLVSSQLDVDRMDFLKRDSFYTGVSEGVINTERIIDMLNVAGDGLVVEAKGIYSIEKFIVARRLMYWQVYLHKTVIAAEKMLTRLLERARWLAANGEDLFMTPALSVFLKNDLNGSDFSADPGLLKTFAALDDYDVFASVKVWTTHPDPILSFLSNALVVRNIFHIELQNASFDPEAVQKIRERVAESYRIPLDLTDYLVYTDIISNKAYNPYTDDIRILQKNGDVDGIGSVSEQLSVAILSHVVTKSYLCYPKNLFSGNPAF